MNNNDIEEDIEILKEFTKRYQEQMISCCFGMSKKSLGTITQKQYIAIENVIAYIERLEKENKELKEYIFIAPNLDKMTAIKYLEIQREGYFRGRNEEQQKAKPIINELEEKANKYDSLVERIKERIKSVDKCYNNLIEPYFDNSINMINTSCMSKREKEEFINKRNCLLVQKTSYENILKLIEEE